MSIITFSNFEYYEEDRIAMMWQLIRMVRELNDEPSVWKLTDPFVDAVGHFLHIADRSELLVKQFLDASIDITTCEARLICVQSTYPIEILQRN